MIDEYEEVELSDKHLSQQLIKYLEYTIFKNQLCRFYAYKLVILLRKAIEHDVSVFFIYDSTIGGNLLWDIGALLE